MNIYNNISFNKIVNSIDDYADVDNESKIIEIIDSINEKQTIIKSEITEVERIFFIWIGTLNSRALEYIEIWQDCFKDRYQINIYVDGHFLLFNHLKKIFNACYCINDTTPADVIVEYQNQFYQKIDTLVSIGQSFDEALIHIASTIGIDLNPALKLARLKIEALRKIVNIIDIRSFDDIFYDERLRRMYFNELTLRHNAACASDILRLSLLYRDGGMYVDVDTLPSHQLVYRGLTLRHGAGNENIVDVLKSEYLLREIRKLKQRSAKRNVCVAKIEEQVGNDEFIDALKNQAVKRVEALFSQPPVCVHRDIMKIATINRYYEVNNNVLIAHKGSRTTRIVLREMSRRYKYLESNNLLFSTESTKKNVDGYLARLDRYRFDSITHTQGTDVTLILTGPCLIHEVLIGLLYEVCHLPKSISPFSVSYLFRIERSFLGFHHQVNYTPEHMRSSWM